MQSKCQTNFELSTKNGFSETEVKWTLDFDFRLDNQKVTLALCNQNVSCQMNFELEVSATNGL